MTDSNLITWYRRIAGAEDIEFADGGTGLAETFNYTTQNNKLLTLTKLDASHLKFRSSGVNGSVEGLVDSSYAIDVKPKTIITTGNATIGGDLAVTGQAAFTNIPTGPNTNPTAASELARKAYVDTKVGLTGNETIAGTKTFTSFPVTPSSFPTLPYQVANKSFVESIASPIGYIHRLRGFNDAVTPATKISFTADSVAVSNGVSTKNLTSISVTVNCGGTGANGLDVGSLVSNRFYFFYIIGKDDGTVAGLASLSATAPSMPTGYTWKKLVSSVFYATSAFRNIYQSNGDVTCLDYGLDISGTVNYASWISKDISAYVPSNTLAINVQMTSLANYIMIEIAWDASGLINKRIVNCVSNTTFDSTIATADLSRYYLNPASPQTIYIRGLDTNDRGHVYLTGYMLDI